MLCVVFGYSKKHVRTFLTFNTDSVLYVVWFVLTFFCLIFWIQKMKVKTTNIVELTPLNPNVSLGKDDFLPSRDKTERHLWTNLLHARVV